MKSLTTRLEQLEALTPTAPQLILFLQRAGTEASDSVTGIRFDDGREVLRQPGESLDTLQDRAKRMIVGGGVVVLRCFGDFAHR